MTDRKALIVNEAQIERAEQPWGSLRWLISRAIVPDAAQTLGICEIHPGCANPVHRHPNCEELVYILSGECSHALDGEICTLSEGMLLRVPAGRWHSARNSGSRTLKMLVVFSSGDRQTEFAGERE